MGAVDRSDSLGEPAVDAAASEIGGVAGQLIADLDVVDVLPEDA